jgi:UPF0716 family protein affecting phage T7 exclusion
MKSIILLIASSTLALLLLVSIGFYVSTSAQENMTTAGTPDGTGAMLGNKKNQTGQGNETQGSLEQMGEALGGVLGGNQSQ